MILKDLHLKHKDEDIYVLGSGPSLGYINPNFLKDKVVICVNNTVDYVEEARHLYLVAKEPSFRMQDQIVEKGGTLVASRFRCANISCGCNHIVHPDHTVVFDTECGYVMDVEQTTRLENSASTLHTALHLGAFMGAKAIVLIGHDCGTLDESVHALEYDKREAQTAESEYKEWMNMMAVEHTTLRLKQILKKLYKVEVYSLNPFINFGLEGHKYKSFS